MENKLKGGKADNMTPKKISDKFGVSVKDVKKQIAKGKKIESEHTDDEEKQTEIASDHVTEFPDYYDRIEKMEKEAEKFWSKKEKTNESKSLIKKLLRENILETSIKQQIIQQIKDLGLNPNEVDVTIGDKPVFVGQGPTTEIDSEITEGLGSKTGKFLISCAIGIGGLVSCKKEERFMYKFIYQDSRTVTTNPNLRGSSYFAYPKGDYSQEFLDSEALRIEKDVEKQLNIDIVDGTAKLIFVEKDNGQWR